MEETKRLAEFVAGTRYEDFPPAVMNEAKLCLLDWLAVTLAGVGDGTVQGLFDVIELAGGNEQATVLGRGKKTSLLNAALLNGTTSHVLDFDDACVEFQGHPSVTLFPALLALAEWMDSGGRDLLCAFVTGFEAGCRVALGASYNHYLSGWHGTSTIGRFASAAGCARLLGLSPDEIVRALGIAGTQAAGIKAVFGTACKPFHAGKACHDGLLSALLAQRGFTSIGNILEGEKCFWEMYSRESEPGKVSEGLGSVWHIMKNQYKFHASCYGTHAPIDAALFLKNEHGIDPGDIASMEIRVSQPMLDVAGKQKPATGLEGKFSIPYSVANALVRGDTGLAAFTDEKVNDPKVVALRDKIRLAADNTVQPFETVVSVETRAGTRSTRFNILERVLGEKEKSSMIRTKFRSLAGFRLSEQKIEEIIHRVDGLEGEKSMAGFMRLLGEQA